MAGVKKKKKAAEVVKCVCLWVVSAVSTTLYTTDQLSTSD